MHEVNPRLHDAYCDLKSRAESHSIAITCRLGPVKWTLGPHCIRNVAVKLLLCLLENR
jgi:hypothetical protein